MFRFRLLKNQPNFDYIRWHIPSFVIGAVVCLAVFAGLFMNKINFGIDFTGGVLIEIRTPEPANVEELRTALSGLSAGTPSIQEFGDNNEVLIRVPGREGDSEAQKEIYAEVQNILGDNVEYRRVEFVGPQVGKELIMAGIKAFIFSTLGILAYVWFRFEWQFGVASVVSLVHDVLFTLGFFMIAGVDFDLTTVAALLMVAGYSLNDTVVIFDRIRENMRKHRKMPMRDLLNLSINQVLARTLMTSLTTILALAALWMFGGKVIQSFVDALLIGTIVGTFSSYFIAVPLLLYFELRRTPPTEQPATAASAT